MSEGNGLSPVTGANEQEFAEVAHRVEKKIDEVFRRINIDLVELAGYFYLFTTQKLWRGVGCDTFAEWLASPEREFPMVSERGTKYSESYIYKLARVYREYVVERKTPVAELEGVELSKLAVALPALDSGEVQVPDAISDARRLTRRDMEIEYGRGRTKPIDPADEPEVVICPTCGSKTRKDRLENAA